MSQMSAQMSNFETIGEILLFWTDFLASEALSAMRDAAKDTKMIVTMASAAPSLRRRHGRQCSVVYLF